MYADGNLKRLATRKSLLQARIAVRRLECVMAAERLARPVRAIDHIVAGWKRLSPFAKLVGVPLGLFLARKLTKSDAGGTSKGKLAALLGALPIILEAWKGFNEAKARTRAPESAPEDVPAPASSS